MHDAYFLHVLILIGINVMVAVSMWLLGITGLISFGQAGFMFIGAMTTALADQAAALAVLGRAAAVRRRSPRWSPRPWAG